MTTVPETTPAKHDEAKLPLWARVLLSDLRDERDSAKAELKRTRDSHTLLRERDWFTIPGPPEDAMRPDDTYQLHYLSANGSRPACSLRPGDVLLVGRSTKHA